MEKLGTNYGGWKVPKNMNLNEHSIIYSAGVGEDISFDLLLQNKYNSKIYLIDPTQKAINHFNEAKQYYDKNIQFTGNIQNDYYSKIANLKPDFHKFNYMSIGLWDKKEQLKFYKQNNNNYVSQSLIENMFGSNYDIVEVNSIKNIMEENNHTHIDLLKLDIEGTEINVLNKMLDDKIYPTYVLCEFDLLLKNKDINQYTNKLINRMVNDKNYKILENDNLNITFEFV
jgi:FkbM family methyltransferase